MPEPEKNLRSSADDLSRANDGHPLKDGEYPLSELDRWEYMYSSQGKYNEQELQRQIDELEKILTGKKSVPEAADAHDAVPLSFALARDLVLRIQLLERLRLQQSVQRQQKKGTPIAILRPDPRNPEQVVPVDIAPDAALEKIEDLDWRIRGTLYQQFWINLLLEEVQRYEAAITRSSALQSLPRDAELERAVRTQLTQLKPLLEQSLLCARVRRLRNAKAPDAEIRAVLGNLPTEAGKDLNVYMSKLDTQIQQVLSVTVGFPLHRKEWLGLKKVERTIPVSPVFHLRSALMQRHMDALLKRENELSGKMDSASSTEKKSLAKEHQELIGDYLEFNAIHLRKFRQLLHLCIEPGPVFAAEEGSGKHAHEFPPAGAMKTDLLQQRGRELAALDTYLEHIDKSVLSNQVLEIDKLFEDILMTVAVPGGIDAIFNEAEKATFVWEFHDAPWRVATGKVLGEWTPQMRPWRRKQILAPLYKHFRLPPTTQWDTPSNEEPRYYHELSPAEQAQWLKRSDVQERVESVRSIVRNFRARLQPEMAVMRGSNAILKDLLTTQAPTSIDSIQKRPMKEILQKQKKLPGQLFAQESGESTAPPADWPGHRTAEQVLQDILSADTAQARGMYFRLIERATSGSGIFEQGYEEYIRGINANLKFHIDAKDLHNYAAANVWRELGLLGAVLGAEAIGAYMAWRAAKYGARKGAGAALRSAQWGARQVKKGADALGEESGLRVKPKSATKPSVKPSAPAKPVVSPKSAPDPAAFERLSGVVKEAEPPLAKSAVVPEAHAVESVAAKRWSRFFGHAGFLLMEMKAVADAIDVFERTGRAELLDERGTLDAAAEIWRDASRGIALEKSGDQFWMEGYNRRYYEALGVIDATGGREWLVQELEVIRELQHALDMILVLRSGEVPVEIPALPARTERTWPEEFWKKMEAEREALQEEGGALTERHAALLKSAKNLHATRAAQFPVYQAGSPLVEQPFARDRSTGKININTSGSALGFIPVKFNNGPIKKFRKAGLERREADEFKYQEAQEGMKELQKSLESFQSDVRRYLNRGWKFERSLHYGPNAPEEPKTDLQGWLRSLDN
ncbi:MAG: hypothetical protein PHX93_00460 [Candidatus Peribacteraceae bacterium]|nr:hypothetical protein [Candidatus Peribacteraceae bacterium]